MPKPSFLLLHEFIISKMKGLSLNKLTFKFYEDLNDHVYILLISFISMLVLQVFEMELSVDFKTNMNNL
jgi:hypothetical protein